MTPEELSRIEKWAEDPDADCVEIVDHAVPDLIAEVRKLRDLATDLWHLPIGIRTPETIARVKEALGA